MKQTVSAPIALIAIVLCAVLAFLLFSRMEPPSSGPEEVFTLPFAPPVKEKEVNALQTSVFPLGVSVVFPPLPADRFAGARIGQVAPGSPAATGGMKPGDLVVSFNGQKITHPFGLANGISTAKPEESIEVVVEREGERQTLVVSGIKPMVTKKELF